MNAIENEQLCSTTSQCLRDGVGSLSSLPSLLKKIIQTKAWEERQISGGKIVRLKSLMELITAKPRNGWGEDPEKIKAVIKDDPEALAMFRESMKHVNQHDVPCNNITEQAAITGTSKAYTLSRLQRESPGLFEAVCRKEMSANAAAIQAGFRKKPSPIDVIRKSWRKLTESEKEMFLKEVQHQKQ